jgi:hypothetical protein
MRPLLTVLIGVNASIFPAAQFLAIQIDGRVSIIFHQEHDMATSSLNPENRNVPDRQLGIGHGTDSLGPSDISDTGSDIVGGEGLLRDDDEVLRLDTGTTSDPEESSAGRTAGPDVGDANLDSDSDSAGSGERAAAGRDTVATAGQDIDTDRIEQVSDDFDADLDIDSDQGAGTPAAPSDQSKRSAPRGQDVRR